MISALIILITFFTGTCNDNQICWNEHKLEWDDFKGVYDSKSPASAVSMLKINLDQNTENVWNSSKFIHETHLMLKFTSVFIPSGSWTILKNDRLLEHEQIHFNIQELYVRKLNKEVLSLEIAEYSKYIDKVIELRDSITEANKKEDLLYDIETDYGNDCAIQKVWKNKIDSLLLNYEVYNDTLIEIIFAR